jgi:hypothetical protein
VSKNDEFSGILAPSEMPQADETENARVGRCHEYVDAAWRRLQQFIVPGAELLNLAVDVVRVHEPTPHAQALEEQCAAGRLLIDIADNLMPEEKEEPKAELVPECIARVEPVHGAEAARRTTFTFEGVGPGFIDDYPSNVSLLIDSVDLRKATGKDLFDLSCLADIGVEHAAQPTLVRGRGVVRFSHEDAVPWFEMELREALPGVDTLTEIDSDGAHVIVQALGTDEDVGERLYLAALWWASTTRLVEGVTVERLQVRPMGDIGVTITRVE